MAYTISKAQAGRSTQLSIGPVAGTTGTVVYVPIYEIRSVDRNGVKWDMIDVSNMNSGVYKEKLQTMLDPGQISFECNRVSADPGQVALENALAVGGAYMFQLTLPKAAGQSTTGDVYTFNALVMSDAEKFETTAANTRSYSLEVTGTPVLTEGA